MIRKLPKVCAWCSNPLATDGGCNYCANDQPDEPVKETPKPQQQLTYALTKPRYVDGCITLTQLAAQRGMQPQLARLRMQRAGIKKPAQGWRWGAHSKALAKVREALEWKP